MDNNQDKVYGIDLGTTYSCIAHIDNFGQAVVIHNSEGDFTTPSVVQFEGDVRVVGKEAKNCAVINPDDVVEMVKRKMGVPNWHFSYEGQDFTAPEISAYILKKIAQDAETSLDKGPVKNVVITCPAYFGAVEREATAKAGQLADLNVLAIIDEPTAAAISYGVQNENGKQKQTVLVYDLGGGTFDVTISELSEKAIKVIAINGKKDLGGRDWDNRIVEYLARQWQIKTGTEIDLIGNKDTHQDLLKKAEEAKRALTSKMTTRIAVVHGGQRSNFPLTLEMFNELTADLLEQTIEITHKALKAALQRGINPIDKILLVGGSTRMRQVKERLEKEFKIPIKITDPDEAVAKGAAIYAQKLQSDAKIDILMGEGLDYKEAAAEVALDRGEKPEDQRKLSEFDVISVSSHSFGIIARHLQQENSNLSARENRYKQYGIFVDVLSNIIKVNDSLPAQVTKTYYTIVDNQKEVLLSIMETTTIDDIVDSTGYKSDEQIGEVILKIPPNMPQQTPIQVTFMLNQQGRLEVLGEETSSNSQIKVLIELTAISKELMEKANQRMPMIRVI